MIIVKLMGGLGNQMFQYAAALSLADRHKTPLKLDRSALQLKPACGLEGARAFDLDAFKVPASFASTAEIEEFPSATINLSSLLLHRLYRRGSPVYFVERHFHYDRAVRYLPSHTYLQGYFQSEKYFKSVECQLRGEFSFKEPLLDRNKALAAELGESNSVAIHVRRGDYITNPKVSEHHGICSSNYYTRAVSLIAERVGCPSLFIFSDDPAWVESNLKFDYPSVLVTHNLGQKDAADLQLISLCKHQIIANSSFSWWGAWLNKNPDKVVVAPARWFNQPDIDTSDLLPGDWILI